MLDFLWKWLREGSKNAILEDVADACEVLTSGDKPVPPRLAALVAKIAPVPALPAAEEKADEPKKTARSKAQ